MNQNNFQHNHYFQRNVKNYWERDDNFRNNEDFSKNNQIQVNNFQRNDCNCPKNQNNG